MGCKGPFDARFEASESSRRALSDYAIQNTQKRNFPKMVFSVFLPQNTRKRLKNTNEKQIKIEGQIEACEIEPKRVKTW